MAQRPVIPRQRNSSISSEESIAYAGHARAWRTPPRSRSGSGTGSRGSTSLSDEVDPRTPFKDSRSTYSTAGTMIVGADRIVIKWETESKAYIHTIQRVEVRRSRGQKEILNNQYAVLKSWCGGSVTSAHDVVVKWRQKDEGNICANDSDGLRRFETKIASVSVRITSLT